jgi:hypothetical protein
MSDILRQLKDARQRYESGLDPNKGFKDSSMNGMTTDVT